MTDNKPNDNHARPSHRDTDGSDVRAILTMAWPLVIATSSRTVMGFVDTLFVARLGETHAAAVAAGGILFFSLISFGMGISSVVNTFASQCLGRRAYLDSGTYGWQSLWLAMAMGAAGMAFYPLIRPLVALLGHEGSMQVFEVQYMQIVLFSCAPSVAAMGLDSFFNGVHRPKVAMWTALAVNLFNVVADYVLIFGKWGFPRMEVAGAAWATVMATVLRVLLLLGAMWWGDVARQFQTRSVWRPDLSKLWAMIRYGSPIGLQWAADIGAWAVFVNVLVASFGTVHIATNQFCWQYLHVSFMPAIGVGIAISAVVGKAIGQGRPDLAQRRCRVGVVMCSGYMGSMGLLFILFGGPMMRLFSNDPQIIHLGRWMMVFAGIFQLADGVNVALTSALKGAGDTHWPGVVTAVLCWTILIAGGWAAVVLWPEAGSFGPWLAATVYIIALSAVLTYRWNSGRWRQIDIFGRPDSDAELAIAITADYTTGQPPGHT